jgi:hypothetical protein
MKLEFLFQGLVNGAVLAAVAFVLSRFTKDAVGRAVLALWLVGAAAMYVLFAVRAGEGAGPIVGEIVGVALYGAVALRGLRGSPMWLAAGWALHPVWDIALHYFGPGATFAPEKYTVSCLTYDLAVAVYIVVAYRTGLVGMPHRGPANAQGARSGY